MENTFTLASSAQKLTLTGDEAIIAIDGRNIKIPLSSLKQYLGIQAFGTVIPEKAPSLNLGAPEEPKVYFGSVGTYVLNGVARNYTKDINIFFWDNSNWSVLEVPVEVNSESMQRVVNENVKASGSISENLLNESLISIGYVGGSGSLDDENVQYRKVRIDNIKEGLYTFSGGPLFHPSGNKNFVYFDKNGAFLWRDRIDASPKVLTFPPGTNYAYMTVGYIGDGDNLNEISNFKLMLNRGMIELPYQPASSPPKLQSIFGYDIPKVDSEAIEQVFERNVVASGSISKNLINESLISIGYVGGNGMLNNDDVEYRKVRIDNVKEGLYTFSGGPLFHASGNKNFVYFDKDGVFLWRDRIDSSPKALTFPPGTNYAYMTVGYIGDGDNLNESSNFKLMLNEGLNALPYKPFSNPPELYRVFGYDIPSGESRRITYAVLKQALMEEALRAGERIIVINGPGGLTIIVTALSKNSIDKSIEIPALDYDFYKLDIESDKIFAYDNISCICRNIGGVWGFIDDEEHVPKGVIGISSLDSRRMEIKYRKTYTKINSLVYSPDETYTINGVSVGASVGTNVSRFNFSSQGIYGEISASGAFFDITDEGFQSAVKSAIFDSASGNITIVHSEINNSIVNVTSKNSLHRAVLVSSGNTSCIIQMIDNDGQPVKVMSGISFQFSRPGTRTLLNSEMGIPGSNIWIQGLMVTEIK